MKSLAMLLSLLLVVGLQFPLHAEPVEDSFDGSSVMLVIDVSGSMAGTRLSQAKEAINQSVAGIDATTAVGLRSYAGSCGNEGDLLVPVGLDNRDEILAATASLTAGGGTPTPDALRGAVGDLPPAGSRTIVLVSDGASSCGPVCPVAEQLLEESEVEFTTFTVGFNAPDSAAADLTCTAEATGGQYFAANDTASLVDAVGGAVSGRELTIDTLALDTLVSGATANSFLVDLLVAVKGPNGQPAIGAVVSVDDEIAGVTGSDGATKVLIPITPEWRSEHPNGRVDVTATLSGYSGSTKADVAIFTPGTSRCSYDGLPRGGSSLGTYVSLLLPGAGGAGAGFLEQARQLLDVFNTSTEVFEDIAGRDVRTTVQAYEVEAGIYDMISVAEVTVTEKNGPAESVYWIVSEDAIDLAPRDLFGSLAGNCFRTRGGGLA